MSVRQSKRIQSVEIEVSSRSDLLGLWFEVDGVRFITAAEDLGHLALVSHKYKCLVAEKVRVHGDDFSCSAAQAHMLPGCTP
jgi:hypothetical protein